jgi:integral membrane sensor domain MASE1
MAIKLVSCRLGLVAGATSAACFAVLLLFEALGVDRAASTYVNVWIASFAAALTALPLGLVTLAWSETRAQAGLALFLTLPIFLVLGYMAYAASQMNLDNGF